MTPETLVPLLAILAVMTRELLWLAAAGILISNLDDLAMDGCWVWLLALRPRAPLPAAPPAPFRHAILVPAWDESAVIAPMLHRLLATQRHAAFTLFVGVYPNDPTTLAAVGLIDDPRVVPVMVGHAGPTTKADCLNHLWRGMLAHEAALGCPHQSIVLHDSEDVLHPDELALFDRYLPTLAMVQVPVLPFVDRGSRWISGHYLDEFAQGHIRDLMVRGALRAPVPSAGVGTAIRRDAMDRLAGADGMPFDAASLTEDYEIGLKLHAMGLSGRMVRHRIDGALVAVREYFPATLESAVRQKSRWLTGIGLQGWDRLGWAGSPAHRWMLLRDRKGLFSAALTVMAYVVALLVLAQQLARAMLAEAAGVTLPPLLRDAGNRLLVMLLLVNAALLVWRLVWRAGFTASAHGWQQGLMSVPRSVTTNIVNALAALRAVRRYGQSLETPSAIPWEKTVHRFPDAMPGPQPVAGHGI